MRHLPEEVVEVVLSYLCPPPCCTDAVVPAAQTCRTWRRLSQSIGQHMKSFCCLEEAVACPEMRLCRVHQRDEIELWAALWHACYTQHQNPFPLRSPHLHALPSLHRRLARHQMPFDVFGVPPRGAGLEGDNVAWIYISPGHGSSLWWRRYCEWADFSDGD